MFSVTKQQPGEGGQFSRKEWTARLTSTASGLTINEGSVIWMASFGSGLIRYTAWPAVKNVSFGLTWKTLHQTLFTPSTIHLELGARGLSTSWAWEVTQVSFIFTLWYFARHIYLDDMKTSHVSNTVHTLSHCLNWPQLLLLSHCTMQGIRRFSFERVQLYLHY